MYFQPALVLGATSPDVSGEGHVTADFSYPLQGFTKTFCGRWWSFPKQKFLMKHLTFSCLDPGCLEEIICISFSWRSVATRLWWCFLALVRLSRAILMISWTKTVVLNTRSWKLERTTVTQFILSNKLFLKIVFTYYIPLTFLLHHAFMVWRNKIFSGLLYENMQQRV